MGLTFWFGGHLLADREIDGFELFVVFLATLAGGEAAGGFFAHTNSKILILDTILCHYFNQSSTRHCTSEIRFPTHRRLAIPEVSHLSHTKHITPRPHVGPMP